jgi:hypothetical protein
MPTVKQGNRIMNSKCDIIWETNTQVSAELGTRKGSEMADAFGEAQYRCPSKVVSGYKELESSW